MSQNKTKMAYTLRPYQQGAVDAAVKFLTDDDGNGIEILPTGSGKSMNRQLTNTIF